MKAEDVQLTQLFAGPKQFIVPIFQRDHSWGTKHCLQLWEDVVRVGSNEKTKAHFVGSVVYVAAEETFAAIARWLLIDGQQRLTTVTLLLAALRNRMPNPDSEIQQATDEGVLPTRSELEDYYLFNTHGKGDRRFKLHLRRTDQETLAALLEEKELPRDVSERIRENFEFFEEKLADADLDVVYRGIKKLVAVDVSLTRGQDDPQMSFESLNSTGLELTQADLIRNFVLMRLDEQLQAKLYENYWQPIEKAFGERYRSDFDKFVRDYLTLQLKPSKQFKADSIYQEFRTYFYGIGSGGSIDELLAKLIITADDRLDKLADDFVEHYSTRWQTGKSMFVCIDKVTCARMFQRIEPRWQAKLAKVKATILAEQVKLAATTDPDAQERLSKCLEFLPGQARWMGSTLIEIIISEAQNEVRDFQHWGFEIIPHRVVMKTGFQTPDGRRLGVEEAFKDPQHPFRVAIVCAMWLTGFDVECLATLYIDKPMKAHTLMQAIARANRVFPGKDCGVIVDYNGMLKSLREALAQYALGDENEGGDGGRIVAPIEELVAALSQAIEAAEKHLLGLGFDPNRLRGASGFARIEAMRDAVDALYASDESKHRFEIMARQIFIRFKALLMERSAFTYAERHDNVEAIYKKLQERRDTADVTEVLKELHRIVNEAIQAQAPGGDHAEGLTVDLSQIDFDKLRDEFASKVQRKHAALQDIRDIVEKKLVQMLARNPMRMDFYKKYQEIIADYNREKDRATVEDTFAKLVALAKSLDAEQKRAVEEGLGDDELALFDLLFKEPISKADRERLKQASKKLLASLRELLQPMPDWTQNTSTQAEVKIHILDHLWQTLPRPPYTEQETEQVAARVYEYVFQRSVTGSEPLAA
jgi:hypothetical protein